MSIKLCSVILLLCSSLSAQVVVVNGASFRGDQPVSAGAWASIKGTFSGVATTLASSLPLQTNLAGVKVTIDGKDAPIYYVSSAQINFLIPYSITQGLKTVQVSTGGGTQTGSVRIIGAAPGLFARSLDTPPQGAIINQDQTINSDSARAKRGEVISIYGTGTGALTRQPQDGAAPGATPILAETTSKPLVYIGGVPAEVQFSGLNPTAPGLWQINAVVPDKTFITGKLPVQVFLDGIDSNEVTVFVQ
jgi:uncharacterized protein (TIGR03437 family)